MITIMPEEKGRYDVWLSNKYIGYITEDKRTKVATFFQEELISGYPIGVLSGILTKWEKRQNESTHS